MADYIYLLENRLSPPQRNALRIAREAARSRGLTIFLVGGAVRDLTSGSPVRDLDVVVQGNGFKSRKDLEKAGAVVVGENDAAQSLYLRLPGHVRMEFGSTLSVTFPKPGKPVLKPASILEDLRRRDFTVNAMALSLNEGSYGLLMDPLNGTADIENRHLRLVSNYGFIEDPVRMIRAARLMARLGWMMDERTQQRYETGKQEGYISVLTEFHRGYELEEIVHEEDPLRVMRGLEAEGWMKHLSPFWHSGKANSTELERLRDAQTQLELQNIHPDNGAANFPLLTAKLSAQETATLKAAFPRQGFVQEIEALEGNAKQFAAQLSSKAAALPSQAWRLITSAAPEAVLWVTYANKNAALQAKLKAFSTEWPQARQKMPYTQMQEMRITPDLPGYEDLLEKLFFELMDGKLDTPEEMKAFLEPYSPPAPPPQINLRRMRAPKKEPKARASKAKSKPAEESAEESIADESSAPENAISQAEVSAAKTPVAAKPRPSGTPKGAVAAVGSAEMPAAPAAPVAGSRPESDGANKTKSGSQKGVPAARVTSTAIGKSAGAAGAKLPVAQPAKSAAAGQATGTAKSAAAAPAKAKATAQTTPLKAGPVAKAAMPAGKAAGVAPATKKVVAAKAPATKGASKSVVTKQGTAHKPAGKQAAAPGPVKQSSVKREVALTSRSKSAPPKPIASGSRQAGKKSAAASKKSVVASKKPAAVNKKAAAPGKKAAPVSRKAAAKPAAKRAPAKGAKSAKTASKSRRR